MRVLSVAAEAFPLVKTGGLADVVGALPAALAPHGVETTTMIPGYPVVGASMKGAKVVRRWAGLMDTPARLLSGTIEGHPLLVLDAPALFNRKGGLYGQADDWRRFAALARAAADVAIDDGYAVLHAHDWQAALAPAYLRYDGASVRSVTTVHNIAFQGQFGADVFPALGLPDTAWRIDGVEYYGGVGFLKAGLAAADAITTVSPTYAAEIRENRFGMGLEGLIAARHARVHGIVNGIDPAVWNPETDAALPQRYTARALGRRRVNKRAIERTFGLEAGDGPLFTVISRLTWQKGMDVLAHIFEHRS